MINNNSVNIQNLIKYCIFSQFKGSFSTTYILLLHQLQRMFSGSFPNFRCNYYSFPEILLFI